MAARALSQARAGLRGIGEIFADDVAKFGDLSRYTGHPVTVTGKITSYQSQAEMVLSDPSQLAY